MIGVRLAIQQDHFRNGNNGLDNRIYLGGIAPFGKVGNALHQLSHHSAYFPNSKGQLTITGKALACPALRFT